MDHWDVKERYYAEFRLHLIRPNNHETEPVGKYFNAILIN